MSEENRNDEVVGYRTVQVTDLREILAGQNEAILVQTDSPETIDLGEYQRIVRLYGNDTIQVTLILIPEQVRIVRLTDN